MLKKSIQKLMRRENLSVSDIEASIKEIVAAENEAQIAAFLTLLSAKGETADEIYGFVKAMRSMMVPVDCQKPLLDIVGTGGDGFNTINISTGSSFLAASCGVNVAKHGNRSVSSLSGSADVLESLGININMNPAEIVDSIEKHHFGFCYAPNFHKALGNIKTIRKKLGVPTTFNLIGPLLNPAQADFLMVGVANTGYLELVADVLLKLETKRAFVFHCAGLDEVCTVAPIDMIEVVNSSKRRFMLDPKQYGFNLCSVEDLQGGSADENALILKRVLQGELGPVSDTLILNAALATYLYGICDSIEQGVALAKERHQNGAGYQLLMNIVAASQSFTI